MALTDIDVA